MPYRYRKFFGTLFITITLLISRSSYAFTSKEGATFGAVFGVGAISALVGVFLSKGKDTPTPPPTSPSNEESLTDLLEASVEEENSVPLGTAHRISLNTSPTETVNDGLSQCRYLLYKLHNKSNRILTVTKIEAYEDINGVLGTDISLVDKNYVDNSSDCTLTDHPPIAPFTLKPNEDYILKIKVKISGLKERSRYIKVEAKAISDNYTIDYKPINIPLEFFISNYSTDPQIEFIKHPLKEQEMVVGGESKTLVYKIKNSGMVDINNLIIKGYANPITRSEDNNDDNNCGAVLKSGAICSVKLIINKLTEKDKTFSHNIRVYDSDKELKSYPIEIKIRGDVSEPDPRLPPNLAVEFVTLPVIEKMELIGATHLGGSQILNYKIKNTGNIPIEKIEVDGISGPIKLGTNSCTNGLGVDDNSNVNNICTISLVVDPDKAGRISQELSVTAVSGGAKDTKTITAKIVVEVVYKDDILITEEMIDKDIRGKLGAGLSFTMPIIVNETDKNTTDVKTIFVGTNKGLLGWSVIDGKPKWQIINKDQIVDMHVIGDSIYYVSGYDYCKPFESGCQSKNKIRYSENGGKSWVAIDAKFVHGIRKIGEKVFVANNHQGIGIIDTSDSVPSIKYMDYVATKDKDRKKVTAFKFYGRNNYICAGNGLNVYFSKTLGKEWEWYDQEKLGLKNVELSANMNSIYCTKSVILVSIEDRLLISKDGGVNWKRNTGELVKAVYIQNNNFLAATPEEFFIQKDMEGRWKPWRPFDKRLKIGEYSRVFFPIYEGDTQELLYEEAEKLINEYRDKKADKKISDKEKGELLQNLFTNHFDMHAQRADYRAILGVRESDGINVVNQRFRQLSLIFHPDKTVDSLKDLASRITEILNNAKRKVLEENGWS